MQSVLLQSKIETRENLITELWEVGTTGVVENDETVEAFFDDDAQVLSILSFLKSSILQITKVIQLPACSVNTENADPIYAGQRFFIVSSSMEHPTPPNRHRLVIDANDAFGSGSHETTQLMIQALETCMPSNSVVLDVGCGSGVLSEVAQKLRTNLVIGCDTHLGAIYSSRKHSPNSHFYAGSIDAIKTSSVDIVMVNISSLVIDLLVDELSRIMRTRSTLILSGFHTANPPKRVSPHRVISLNDWSCWICHPEDLLRRRTDLQSLQPFAEQWW